MKTDGGEPERQSNPAGRSVSRWIAGVAVARDYRLAWPPHDAMAGVSLSAVLVPAGMAYAEAPARGAGQSHEKLFTHNGLRMGVVNCCEEALTLGFAKSRE